MVGEKEKKACFQVSEMVAFSHRVSIRNVRKMYGKITLYVFNEFELVGRSAQESGTSATVLWTVQAAVVYCRPGCFGFPTVTIGKCV